MISILFRFFTGLSLILSLSACSLMLDPENCSSDSDCEGGICQDGICLLPQGGSDAEGEADGESSEDEDLPDERLNDLSVPDVIEEDLSSPEAGDLFIEDEGIQDQGGLEIRPDLVPIPVAPQCEIFSPLPEESLTREDHVEVQLRVSDPDTPLEALDVRLNGEVLELDEEGGYSGDLELDEGLNPIQLQVEDPDGERCELELEISRDSTAPVLELSRPQTGEDLTANSSYLVRFQVNDEHFLPKLFLNDELWDEGLRWFEDQSAELRLELQEGENLFRLKVEDELGNSSQEVSLRLEMDSQPPDLQILAPQDGDRVGTDQILLRGHVSEEAALNHAPVIIQVISAEGTLTYGEDPAIYTDRAGDFSQNVELREGENQLRVCVTDQVGNNRCETVRVEMQVEEACAALTGAAPGQLEEGIVYLSSANSQIQGSICPGVNSVTLRLGEQPVEASLQGEHFQIDLNLPEPGEYTATLEADTLGSHFEFDFQILYDATPPEVEVQELQEAGLLLQCTRAEHLSVCGLARDPESGLGEAVTLNGLEVFVQDNGNFCLEVPLEISGLEQADFLLEAQATNRVGLSSSAQQLIDVDRQAPTLDWDHPDQSWLGGGAEGTLLSGQIRDGVCSVNSMRFIGLRAVPIQEDLRFEMREDFADGEQTVRVQLMDQAGNMRELEYSFYVDTVDPLITMNSAAFLITAEDEVEIVAEVSDLASGLRSARIDGSVVNPSPSSRPGWSEIRRRVNILDRVEGDPPRVILEIEIEDLVGNQANAQVEVTLDRMPPVVEIEHPAPGAAISPPLSVTGRVNDPGGGGVEQISVNGQAAVINHAQGTWFASQVPVGPDRLLHIEASDTLENQTEPQDIEVSILEFGEVAPSELGLEGITGISWLGVEDSNFDGRLDLLALSDRPESVSLRLILGAAGYEQQPLELPKGFSDVVQGDFDSDGDADLIFLGEQSSVWLQEQGGALLQVENTGLPPRSRAASVGDVNRDGRLDLLLQGELQGLFLGLNDGSFQNGAISTLDECPDENPCARLSEAAQVELLPLNDDGVLDALAIGEAGLQIWHGQRDQSFLSVQTQQMPGHHLALGDPDGDASLEVLTLGAQLELLDEAPQTLGAGMDGGLRLADLDGDNRDEILIFGTGGLQIWTWTEAGYQARDWPGLPELSGVSALLARDLDLDGDVDLLLATEQGLRYFRSNLSLLRPELRYIFVSVRRSDDPSSGAGDAIGAQLYLELEGGPPFDRVSLPPTFGPISLPIAELEGVSVQVRYLDLGEEENNREERLILAGTSVQFIDL